MNPEDLIVAAFAVTGFERYINALQRATGTLEALTAAEAAYNAAHAAMRASPTIANYQAMLQARAQMDAWANAAAYEEAGFAALRASAAWAAVAASVIYSFDKMISSFQHFEGEVMNIRDLTGSSEKQAFGLAAMARAVGMNDSTVIRDLLRMNRSVFSSKGQAALSRLGVSPNPNLTGLALFEEIANKLHEMPAGMRRTNMMESIFGGSGQSGSRGLAALLPLLRLTGEQMKQMKELEESWTPGATQRAQEYATNVGLLGQSFQRNVTDKMVANLLPAINAVLSAVERIVVWFGRLDRLLGGALTWVMTFGLLAVTIMTSVTAVARLIEAFNLLNVGLRITEALEAGVQLLSGPVGWAVLAGAGIAVGGIALANMSSSKGDDATDRFGDAVDQFGNVVNRMEDSFGMLRGNGIPRGISETDLGSLIRHQALGSIG